MSFVNLKMEQQILLLLALVFTHIAGDFYLQPNAWVLDKKKNSYRSLGLLKHVGVHTLLAALVFLYFDWRSVYLALVIGAIHWLIDFAKIEAKGDEIIQFMMDQAAHLLYLLLVWEWWASVSVASHLFENNVIDIRFGLYALAYFIVFTPMSIFMGMATAKWHHEITVIGLKEAGRWIGRLERLLILTFVLHGQFQAIGFLITAKSVFRFGDLMKADNQKRTEYILIGTLISFTITIFLGLFVLWLEGLIVG